MSTPLRYNGRLHYNGRLYRSEVPPHKEYTLLDETVEVLQECGKSPADVRWVGNKAAQGSWDDFAALANFEYDAGFGRQEINDDLVIVGDDWWLERYEYDGSEEWAFKTPPRPNPNAQPLSLDDLKDRP